MLGRLKERLSPERTMKRQEKRQRRAMQFEMLERRILPSAGGVIASHMAKQMTDMAPLHLPMSGGTPGSCSTRSRRIPRLRQYR